MKITTEILNTPKAVSFEYYPPGNHELLPDFYTKVIRMSKLNPVFIDVTWGTGMASGLTSLEISQKIQQAVGIPVMLHLTCTGRSKQELMEILKIIRKSDIKNIMALRGNKPENQQWQPHPDGFRYAAQLVEFIRHHFDDEFVISVAAYPEGHNNKNTADTNSDYFLTEQYDDELQHLKQKCDAGADFIVTQLCYDMQRIKKFKQDCRKINVQQKIIPGILPIHGWRTYDKINAFDASIPESIKLDINKIPNRNTELLQQYASQLLHDQLKSLHNDDFNIVHIYTLNFEKVIRNTLNKFAK